MVEGAPGGVRKEEERYIPKKQNNRQTPTKTPTYAHQNETPFEVKLCIVAQDPVCLWSSPSFVSLSCSLFIILCYFFKYFMDANQLFLLFIFDSIQFHIMLTPPDCIERVPDLFDCEWSVLHLSCVIPLSLSRSLWVIDRSISTTRINRRVDRVLRI